MKNRLLIIFGGYASPFQGVTVPPFEQSQSIPSILDRARKDYAQFDIEVTDKDDGSGRPTAIIAVGGGSATQGGSSFVGGFFHQGTLNDGFVYSAALQNNPKWIADAVSHEAGHLFGLQHQAQWTNGVLTDKYRRDGAIMGSPYFIDNPFWTTGQTPAGATQDDVAVLTAVLSAAQAPAPPPIPLPEPTIMAAACQMHLGAGQPVSDHKITKVPVNIVDHDTAGMADVARNRINIIRSGLYLITATTVYLSLTASTKRAITQICRNGVQVKFTECAGLVGSCSAPDCVAALPLNAGDYVELGAYQDSGTTQIVNGAPQVSFGASVLAVSELSS